LQTEKAWFVPIIPLRQPPKSCFRAGTARLYKTIEEMLDLLAPFRKKHIQIKAFAEIFGKTEVQRNLLAPG
jgi:hypothetical protein